jgi:predicted RNA-binding Zn-ribbon protein involved in translation (DUF1610 family)
VDTFSLALVVILGIVLVIVLYIQFRYLRPKKDEAIGVALERDGAYNAMTTSQAVSSTLRERGKDTSEADKLLIEAELAYNRGDFIMCTDSSRRAKDCLAVAPMAKVEFEPQNKAETAQSEGSHPEQPKICEARKLPPNYLESKFMIETASDEIEQCRSEGKNVADSDRLLDEAKAAFERKEYDLALRKSLKAKKSISEGSAPPERKVAEIVSPIKTVKRDIVLDSSKAESCPTCGTVARDDDNFCAKCGKPIERKRLCPTCGSEVSEDDVFCRKCGTEVRVAYQCPQCGAIATDDDPVCVKCGARFES